MEKRSFGAATRRLAATVAVMAVLGLGFAATRASANSGDSVVETKPMHEEMRRMHQGDDLSGHARAEMNEMHDQMSARLSEEDRELHDRMHEACKGHIEERNDT